jgi:uncharacterized protein (DUF1697 family)
MTNTSTRYVALLRGINVGGHHKVPMAGLSQAIRTLGFDNVTTILNSGNVIFTSSLTREEELEDLLANHLETVFGFPIPVLIRRSTVMLDLISNNPFRQIELTRDTRLYISFLKEEPACALALPWTSDDGTYQILEVREKTICSVLDLSATQTPKGMDSLEKLFGKNITTRNWNTILRIADKCQ